jgi:selenoprotein W-related protein
MLRASWIAMELLTTFIKEDRLASVTLIPTGGGGMKEEEGGIFRVSANDAVLWDRKVMGRFPESKEVKQLVRDIVDPSKDLGHSDVGAEKNIVVGEGDCIECKEREANEKKGEGKVQDDKEQSPPLRQQQQSILAAPSSLPLLPSIISNNQQQNRIFIEYSTGGGSIDSPDNGLYRAAYYANELLSMVYERNAWWKRRRQQISKDDNVGWNDDAMPIVVDSVSFVPNRRVDHDYLVSQCLHS